MLTGTSRHLEPQETLRVPPVDELPEQQRSSFPTLKMLLKQKKEALAKLSPFAGKRPRDEEPSVSSDDETSEDESRGFDIDYKV
ncbi:uncharacterized protein N7496_002048 [Penicillium cataractarum]|uniref:Uncharacterized protein n=1 Tax=Penicillium cataractarum TaxID=2100454 RepID=A0A9X0B7J2_9EURO|nr:uncharacterized protein N7496_002048 [Penicillium cataractarum]KAJ5390980.1 hypothetical protein N7496_002048 [Penicillium cataractarum]